MPNGSRSNPAEFDRVPRRGVVALVATVIGLVFLVSFHTPDDSVSAIGGNPPPVAVVGLETPTPTSIPRSTPHSGRQGAPTPTSAPPQPTATPDNGGKQVVDGPQVDNPYGPVQVEVTLQGHRLLDAQAIQLPSDRRFSRQISDYVGPILRQEAIKAQSANIDIVSGATFTSEAYARSLQAALDQAHP
jgi:uncharacterized protein with FMN-binding domain